MNLISKEKFDRIKAAILEGMTLRQVERATGVSKLTVAKYREIIVAMVPGGVIFCKCGKASGHNGWCSYRFEESPARRRFMSELRGREVEPQHKAPPVIIDHAALKEDERIYEGLRRAARLRDPLPADYAELEKLRLELKRLLINGG